jgi:hypothetical protein
LLTTQNGWLYEEMAQALGKIIGGIIVGVCGLKQRNEKLRIKKFGGCELRVDVKRVEDYLSIFCVPLFTIFTL